MLFWLWVVYGFSVMLVIMFSFGKCDFNVWIVCCVRLFLVYVVDVFSDFSDGLIIGNRLIVGMFSFSVFLVIFSSFLIDSCFMFGIDGIVVWFVSLCMNIG